MTRWALSLGVLALGAALLNPIAATAAGAAEPPVPPDAVELSSFDVTVSAYGPLRSLATPSTHPADVAVAAACLTDGRQISASKWARLAPAVPTTVKVSGGGRWSRGRESYPLPGGVALVSTTTGEVLDCADGALGPFEVDPEGVYAVAYMPANATYDAISPYGWDLSLSVHVVPGGRPQSTTLDVSPASGSATLAWQPPPYSDGALALTGYRVSRTGVDDGGGGPWSTVVSPETRSFTFTQLRPGEPYELSVQAVNAVGAGPQATQTAQLGRLAGSPKDVTSIFDAETRWARLSWSPPADDGGGPTVTGYRVARDGDDTGGTGPWSTVVPATARSQTFTSLLLDKPYTLSVQAITDAGPGPVSSVSTTLTARNAGYLPWSPKRLLDTRSGLGAPRAAQVGPGGTLTLQLTGAPGSGLSPTGSTAVALNVTATGATAPGYVSVYPTGSPDGPASSNLNVTPGQTVPNLVISKVATDGTVTLYNANGTVDLIADLQGVFTADTNYPTSTYLPVDPQRLLDTRTGLGTGSAAKIAAGGSLRLQVTGTGRAPTGATAVVLNVTATNPTAVGYLSVFRTGSATGPSSSNLNVAPGETVPNLVVSEVAADGSITIYNHAGTVDVIADLQGAFVRDTGGGNSYRPSNPRRVLDTRTGLGVGVATGAVGPGRAMTLQVTGASGTGLAPVGSTAVVLNVTATGATSTSYVSVYPTNFSAGPRSSNLNLVPGRTTPNLVISKVAPDGTVTLYNDSGTVHLIADLQGSYGAGAVGSRSTAQPVTAAVTG